MPAWFSVLAGMCLVLGPALSYHPASDRIPLDVDEDGVDDNFEQQIIDRFSPVVKLHPAEHFFPTDVHTFANHSVLMYDHTESHHRCVVVEETSGAATLHAQTHPADASCTLRGKCTHSGPLMYSRNDGNISDGGSRFYQKIRSEEYYFGADGVNVKDVPAYAHVHPAANNAHAGLIAVQFWFLYAFNGPTDILFGQHEGDWEHVSLVVHPHTLQVHEAYFAAHSHEALWIPASNVTFADGTHPVVYSAKYSHASYESAGIKRRKIAGGIVSDTCADGGIVWRPKAINVGEQLKPMRFHDWLLYNGKWGSEDERPSFLNGSPPSGPAVQYDYWFLR